MKKLSASRHTVETLHELLARRIGTERAEAFCRTNGIDLNASAETRFNVRNMLHEIAILEKELARLDGASDAYRSVATAALNAEKATMRSEGICAAMGIATPARSRAVNSATPAASENKWLAYWTIHTKDPAKARKFYLASRDELDDTPQPWTTARARGEFFRKLGNERNK